MWLYVGHYVWHWVDDVITFGYGTMYMQCHLDSNIPIFMFSPPTMNVMKWSMRSSIVVFGSPCAVFRMYDRMSLCPSSSSFIIFSILPSITPLAAPLRNFTASIHLFWKEYVVGWYFMKGLRKLCTRPSRANWVFARIGESGALIAFTSRSNATYWQNKQ